jgi:hypothetical protein
MGSSQADIQSDCHNAGVMSIEGNSNCYYRCNTCGKECTVHKRGRVVSPQGKTPADTAMDEFCLKVEREMESPAQELREAERHKYVTDRMAEGYLIERVPFVPLMAEA